MFNAGYEPGHKGYYDTTFLNFWANTFQRNPNDIIPTLKLISFIGEYMKVSQLHINVKSIFLRIILL